MVQVKSNLLIGWIEALFFITMSVFYIIYYQKYPLGILGESASNFDAIVVLAAVFISLFFIKRFLTSSNDSYKEKRKSKLLTILLVNYLYMGASYRIFQLILIKYEANIPMDFINVIGWLILIISLLICRRNIELNFKVEIKKLFVVLAGFLIYGSIMVLYITKIHSIDFFSVTIAIKTFIEGFFYPALYEEIIFRYLMITVIKDYISNERITVILQAIVFGLFHFILYYFINQVDFVYSILGCAAQTLVGYTLGIIYIRTKSLTYGTVFHALINTI
ncbi:CPBP family intramembrane glutamic endopeptidase [Alloiococcus sp. CFN-8]|uniref:CPBP family intramembrane glutamic endopeptidase n=1 Tax=Alloiococcus sp. CFN-8 TaxID=3416081 RepID=UPI003CEF5B36